MLDKCIGPPPPFSSNDKDFSVVTSASFSAPPTTSSASSFATARLSTSLIAPESIFTRPEPAISAEISSPSLHLAWSLQLAACCSCAICTILQLSLTPFASRIAIHAVSYYFLCLMADGTSKAPGQSGCAACMRWRRLARPVRSGTAWCEGSRPVCSMYAVAESRSVRVEYFQL